MTGHRTSESPAQAENRMSGFTLLIPCMVHRYSLCLSHVGSGHRGITKEE